MPKDIAIMKKNGKRYLVYIDCSDRTVNIMKSDQEQEMIMLEYWNPIAVCSTSSGELLVIVISDSGQTKVWRYSESTMIQSIEITSNCPPYFAADGSEHSLKYICENNNFDICVSSSDSNEVVVFDQAENFRFNYTGNPSLKHKRYWPKGITTASQSRILIADSKNKFIHILDKERHFFAILIIAI